MLPFVWSENTSCDGKPQPLVTALDILFAAGQLGLGFVFLALVAGSVGLAFLAARTRRRWWAFAAETVAGLTALGTTMMCAMMMTYGRHDQPLDHPAAWVGTLAAFGIAMQTWFSSGEALRRAIRRTRARRKLLQDQASARSRALRFAIAEPAEPLDWSMRTADDHAAEAEEAAEQCGASIDAQRARRSVPRRA